MLTPLDIQKRTFNRAMSGYSIKEVEEFLGLVAAAMEKHINESFDLKDKCEFGERELSKYQSLEKTMSDTLIIAKSTSEEMISSAQERANLIVEQAEQEAQKIKYQTQVDIEMQKMALDQLKVDFNAFKSRFLSVLNAQKEIVENYNVDVDVN